MASGSFNLTRTGATSSYVSFLVNWSSNSNGSSANSSTVNVDVYVKKSNASSSNTLGTANTSVYVSGGGTLSENGLGFTVVPGGTTLLFRKSFTVPHNADGTKTTTISVNVGGDVVWGNGSQTVTLDRIPRQANITGASNFNDEQNPSFTFSKAGAGTLDVWLEPNPNGQHLAIRTNIPNSGSYTWNLTEDERNQLRKACKSNSCTCRIGLYTHIGGNSYHSYKDVKFSIINANPVFNDFEWETTNYEELTGDNSTVIKGYSNVKTIVSEENKAFALKEAILTSYQTTIGSKSITNNNLTYPVETLIEKLDGASITMFVIDSRGNSTSIVKPITNYIDYQKINGLITNVKRTQDVNSEVNLQFEGEIDIVDFGQVTNDIVSCKYYFKETTSNEDFVEGETILTPTLTQKEGTKYRYEVNQKIAGDLGATGFDINKSFLIKIVVNDKISFIEDTETLGNGSPAIAVKGNCVSLGAPYDEQRGGRVQINGIVYNNNVDSTEEQIVGIYKGKFLYRKVLDFYFTATGSTNINIEDLNIDTILKYDAQITKSGENASTDTERVPYYLKSSDYCRVFFRNNQTIEIRYQVPSNYTVTTCRMILYCTKTTD